MMQLLKISGEQFTLLFLQLISCPLMAKKHLANIVQLYLWYLQTKILYTKNMTRSFYDKKCTTLSSAIDEFATRMQMNKIWKRSSRDIVSINPGLHDICIFPSLAFVLIWFVHIHMINIDCALHIALSETLQILHANFRKRGLISFHFNFSH